MGGALWTTTYGSFDLASGQQPLGCRSASRGVVEVVIVTRKDVLIALNSGDRFWLALMRVRNGFAGLPQYTCQPFSRKLDFSATVVGYSIDEQISRAA